MLAHPGNPNFGNVKTQIGTLDEIDDNHVCEGALAALEGPILVHDFRFITIETRMLKVFCLTVVGLCKWLNVEAYPSSMTKKLDTSRVAQSRETPTQVVHI
ncbi:hypothetical protein EG329_007611 [Mollisiaceae sp. DMI_Dod_QoI]|nr:hypothetical protein EG329_007611 [Helotiales sp. DMI_Dod_QoI]